MINEQREAYPAFPHIPDEIAYLLDVALRFTDYHFDDAIQSFIATADESKFAELAATAERARLAGDYARVNHWMDAVSDCIGAILDREIPYHITISQARRREIEGLLGPNLSAERREKAIHKFAEAGDQSDTALRRRERRGSLITEANQVVHHMDVYFLFGLLDACEFSFE